MSKNDCSQQRDCSGFAPDSLFIWFIQNQLLLQRYGFLPKRPNIHTESCKIYNEPTRLFHLTKVYFVVVNDVEEINNEIKQKTRKCASDMKKPKNVDVLTKTAKRNALWIFSVFLSKVKCCNYVFRYFRQNGTFFREIAFAAMFFRFFCVFRC